MRVNESGRSMIEMLGVLAIVGVLSVGGIAGYSKAMTKFKTNKVADQVSMIVTNIRTLYAQQTTYDGLNNVTAFSMGVVPDDLGTTGDDLSNAFAGGVAIRYGTTGNDATGGGTGAFQVSFGNLPKEACITLATNDWGSSYSSGFIGMKISGGSLANTSDVSTLKIGCTDGDADGNGWCSSKGAMLVTEAASVCSDQSVLTWKFY